MNALIKPIARAALLAGFCLSLAFCTTDAAAQTESEPEASAETGDDDRAMGFQSVSGPEVERVPGGQLLIYAYGLAWLMVLSFMWRRIGKMQSAANEDLARLTKLIEKKD